MRDYQSTVTLKQHSHCYVRQLGMLFCFDLFVGCMVCLSTVLGLLAKLLMIFNGKGKHWKKNEIDWILRAICI